MPSAGIHPTHGRHRFRGLLAMIVTGALVGAAPALWAEDPGNWYIGASAGANYGAPAEVEGFGLKVNYDLGLPRPRGVIGRRLGERWWLEVEVAQRKTKGEVAYTPGGGPSFDVAPNDRFTSGTVMLSALREFRAGPWLTPYVGFGAGYSWITYELGEFGLDGADDIPLIADDTTAAALEATLGVRFPLSRRIDLGLEYEYWRAPDVEIESLAGDSLKVDQTVHSGWLTFYYYPGAERSAGIRARRRTEPAPQGWYAGVNGGVGWVRDSETSLVTLDAFAPGGIVTLAVGHTLGARWRLEGEYAWRHNKAELVDFGPCCGERRIRGKLSSSSLAVNVHYDFFPNAPVQPTFGVGVGGGSMQYRMSFVDDGTDYIHDDAGYRFFQTVLGFNVEISSSLTFRTAWRMMVTNKHDVELDSGEQIEPEIWHHAVEFGLRYQLGG